MVSRAGVSCGGTGRPSPFSKSKKTFLGVCLVGFGILVGLCLVEGLVRVFYPNARDHVVPGRLFVMDDHVGWKLGASRTSTHHSRYFEAPYRINSLGFRDKLRVATKGDDTYRILLYGDSLIFGWGLKEEERFSDLIENQRSGLEMWNLGVPGYGLDQEIVSYETDQEFQADEVMFFVGASTISRIHTGYAFSKYKPMFTRLQDGRLTLVPVPRGKNAATSLLYEVISPFYLPYFVQGQIARVQEAATLRASGGSAMALPTIESRRLIDGFSKDMLRMAWSIARQRGHRMTILVANLSRADRAELRDLCREIGAEYLEIGPEISATATTDANSDLIFGKYDKHWNAKANRLIAGQLLAQMKQGTAATTNPVQ